MCNGTGLPPSANRAPYLTPTTPTLRKIVAQARKGWCAGWTGYPGTTAPITRSDASHFGLETFRPLNQHLELDHHSARAAMTGAKKSLEDRATPLISPSTSVQYCRCDYPICSALTIILRL